MKKVKSCLVSGLIAIRDGSKDLNGFIYPTDNKIDPDKAYPVYMDNDNSRLIGVMKLTAIENEIFGVGVIAGLDKKLLQTGYFSLSGVGKVADDKETVIEHKVTHTSFSNSHSDPRILPFHVEEQ